MAKKIKVIRGPVVPGQTSRPWESNIFRPVYNVYLDSGIIVTNPDQFPSEEVIVEEAETQDEGIPQRQELFGGKLK